MLRVSIPAFLACLMASQAMANLPEQFAACVAKKGADYIKARDQFLAANPEKGFLEKELKSPSWQNRLTATILQGWQKHEKDYRKLLATPKVATAKGTVYYPWSRDLKGIKFDIAPLLYELLLKEVEEGAAWDATQAFLSLDQAQPDTPVLEVDWLHQYLREASPASGPFRKAVASLLGTLPVKYHLKEPLLTSLKAELARKDKDLDVVKNLLDGLGQAAEKMTPQEKDLVVRNLPDAKELEKLLGQTEYLYVLGTIGGDSATKALDDYLNETSAKEERRWALGMLSKGGTMAATKILIAYADDPSAELSEEAIAGLGRMRYADKAVATTAVTKLTTIAAKDSAQQHEAVLSLGKISARYPKNMDLQRQIRTSITTISASKPKNKEVLKELESIRDSLKDKEP